MIDDLKKKLVADLEAYYAELSEVLINDLGISNKMDAIEDLLAILADPKSTVELNKKQRELLNNDKLSQIITPFAEATRWNFRAGNPVKSSIDIVTIYINNSSTIMELKIDLANKLNQFIQVNMTELSSSKKPSGGEFFKESVNVDDKIALAKKLLAILKGKSGETADLDQQLSRHPELFDMVLPFARETHWNFTSGIPVTDEDIRQSASFKPIN